MANHSGMKLGARPSQKSHLFQTLQPQHLPSTVPTTIPNWGQNIKSWPMFLNDQLGCCTIASLFHLVMVFSSYGVSTLQTGTDAEVLSAYETIDGYNPAVPASDQGGDPSNVFHCWLTSGMTIDGNKDMPLAVFRLPLNNLDLCRVALSYFGPLVLDVELPLNAQTQDVWHYDSASPNSNQAGSWGGHQLIVTELGAQSMQLATWDQIKLADLNWWAPYVTEAWAVLHPLWLRAGLAPSGLDYDQLVSWSAQTLQVPG